MAETRNRKPYWILLGIITLLAAGLMIYAQTDAFAWDEGFHLLTAQLITRGKRPWIDFNFSQTPLNAYWNAFWFKIFGDTWRTAHAVATLMTTGATLMTADYLYRRFPIERWRFVAALMAAFVIGMNVLIVQYGPIGQAYGLALFLVVAAFRMTIVSVDSSGIAFAAAAGFLASAAAGSTQLTTPAFVVLAIWTLVENRAGHRWTKLVAFLAAGVIPMLPVAWLLAQGPRQAFFNIIQYNLIFRQIEWPGAIPHDIEVMAAWLNSAQALIIGLLALAGLLFARRWPQPERSEFYLCAWLSLGIGAFISSAHPTFQRYYLLALPFLAILAAAGMYAISIRLFNGRRAWPVLALALLFSLELTKALYDKHSNVNWLDLEKVAAKANQVTPPGALMLGDEFLYLITKRPPPSGMELSDSHKLDFPPERATPLHLVSESEILKQLKAGRYATAVDCGKGHKLTEDEFRKLYRQKEEGDTCTVYWDFKSATN